MRRFFRGAVVVGLFVSALFFPGCDSSPKRIEILPPRPSSAQTIKIGSSDEPAPLFRRIAEAFASRKGLRFEIIQTQSVKIPGLLQSGAIDAGVTARRGSSEIPGGFSYVPFARDAVVFIVSKDAGVDSLTTAQLRGIFKGEITDWGEVGGKRGPVNVVDRPEISVTRRALTSGLFRGDFPVARRGVLMHDHEVAVEAMRNLPGFVGFASMAAATTGQIPGVRIAVDGMPPLFTGSGEKSYPARMEYGILFNKDAPEGVRDLANFLQSTEGWHELVAMGLLPASKDLSMTACHCRDREETFDPAGGKSALVGTFTLAVVPELGAIQQENRYAAITQRIADELGVRARLVHLLTYRQIVSEFSEGRIDAAFVGSMMYGILHRRMNVIPLARPESGGVSRYRGLIIARRGTGIRSFADLKGKRFAYVPDTSAGELFPRAKVIEEGGAWPGFFSAAVKASTHQSAIQLVLSGGADAAAVKDLVLRREQVSSEVARKELVVLSASDYFPENALVVSGSFDVKDRSTLRSMLLSLDKEKEGKEALRRLGADRMIPTSDEDYTAMYALARKIRYPMDSEKR